MEYDQVQYERATRVAIASSLYMRKCSLELQKQTDNTVTRNRQDSYGKIVKNLTSKNKQKQTDSKQLPKKPLQRICRNDENIRKTPIFGYFKDDENSKIKAIQKKYSRMLEQYDHKKQMIKNQINNIKNQKQQNRKNSQQDIKIGSDKQNQKSPVFVQQIKHDTHNKKSIDNQYKYFSDKSKMMPQKIYVESSKQKNKRSLDAEDKLQVYRIQRNNQCINKKGSYTDRNPQKYAQVQKKISMKIRKNSQDLSNIQQPNNYKINCKNSAQKPIKKFPSFFKLIQKQIQLQTNLRTFKQLIYSLKGTSKNHLITEFTNYLTKINIKYDFNKQQEYDLFFIPNKKVLNLLEQEAINQFRAQFVKAYQQCQKNWSQIQLNEQQATQIFNIIDFQKKQQIQLKQLCREISLILGRNYQTRELYRIFQRISPFTKFNFCNKLGNY